MNCSDPSLSSFSAIVSAAVLSLPRRCFEPRAGRLAPVARAEPGRRIRRARSAEGLAGRRAAAGVEGGRRGRGLLVVLDRRTDGSTRSARAAGPST